EAFPAGLWSQHNQGFARSRGVAESGHFAATSRGVITSIAASLCRKSDTATSQYEIDPLHTDSRHINLIQTAWRIVVAKGKTETPNEPNMMDMVRSAMSELGLDAKPLKLQAHIKQKFSKEMTTQMISNYKFQIRKQGGAQVRTRGRR